MLTKNIELYSNIAIKSLYVLTHLNRSRVSTVRKIPTNEREAPMILI